MFLVSTSVTSGDCNFQTCDRGSAIEYDIYRKTPQLRFRDNLAIDREKYYGCLIFEKNGNERGCTC